MTARSLPTDHFAGRMELARSMVKEGELSLVKIGRRSFVQAEKLADFLREEPV